MARVAKDVHSGLTGSRLAQLFDYIPETGEFIRKITAGGEVAGTVAGSLNDQGYVKLNIDRQLFAGHRLAWVWMFGTWPKNEIDHINGIRNDNRIANLREATITQQCRNSKKYKNNTSGYKGVNWSHEFQRWEARIRVEGRLQLIGRFKNIEAAAAAYSQRANEVFGEFVRN